MPAYVLYRAQELGWNWVGVFASNIYIYIYEVVSLMHMCIHF